MQLTRDSWTNADGKEFATYLSSYSKGKEKGEWEKRIVNTALPAIAVPCQEVDRIVREIAKGNATAFLDLDLWENHTQVLIRGKLIGKIKDFETFRRYALDYAKRVDNWSATDGIRYTFTAKNKPLYFSFALDCLRDTEHTFVRRLGLIILLKMSGMAEYINGILCAVDTLEEETEYYVNMANAWLISECFSRFRDKTLAYLTGGLQAVGLSENERDNAPHLNTFTINKAISKCRDSYRVSVADKEFLKTLRVH